MRLTSFTDYGLRALMRLAGEPERSFTTDEIAREFRISRHHLVKIVAALAGAGPGDHATRKRRRLPAFPRGKGRDAGRYRARARGRRSTGRVLPRGWRRMRDVAGLPFEKEVRHGARGVLSRARPHGSCRVRFSKASRCGAEARRMDIASILAGRAKTPACLSVSDERAVSQIPERAFCNRPACSSRSVRTTRRVP